MRGGANLQKQRREKKLTKRRRAKDGTGANLGKTTYVDVRQQGPAEGKRTGQCSEKLQHKRCGEARAEKVDCRHQERQSDAAASLSKELLEPPPRMISAKINEKERNQRERKKRGEP